MDRRVCFNPLRVCSAVKGLGDIAGSHRFLGVFAALLCVDAVSRWQRRTVHVALLS